MKFKTVQIKDLGQVLTGNTPPTSKRELYGNRYPLIKAKDMVLGSRYIGTTEESLSEKGREAYRSKLLPRNATCVVTIGTLGKLCLTRESSFCNQAINAIIPSEDYDNFYVFYLMKTVIEQLRLLDSGTASGRENVSKSAFSSIKLKVPPLPTQQKIAAILSVYDDLIENNNRRIEILEEMARMLYREWFVKFRYPGHESDRFYESELGLIPEGWEVVKVGDVAEVGRGSSPRPIKDRRYFDDGNIPWIKIADATKSGKFLYETKQKLNEYGASFSRLLPKGSLIVAASGTLGYTQMLGVDGCIHDGWLYLDKIKKVNKEYLYYLFKDQEKFFYNSAYGAAIQNVNTTILRSMKILVPRFEIQKKFVLFVANSDKLIDNLGRKNNNLRQTRDLLLPRLISGEIDVENLDIKGVNN